LIPRTSGGAIRERRLPKDGKHVALSLLAKTLIEKRGRLDYLDIDRFVAAGFSKDLALELLRRSQRPRSRTILEA
jgi:hypothetical protein